VVLIDIVIPIAICACVLASLPGRPQPLTDRWIFVMRDLTQPESFERTISLVPEAAACGCTAMVLSDRAFQRLGELSSSERASYRALQAELTSRGMDLIPTVMLMGYGRSILRHDPNLAEGLPVRDALFQAQDGGAVHFPDPPPALVDGSFEISDGNRLTRWEGQGDAGRSIFVDGEVCHSGGRSLRMQDFPPAAEDEPQSRVWQTVTVGPFRQYHLSVWAGTEGLEAPNGTVSVCVRPVANPKQQLNLSSFALAPTQDRKQYHIVFNSLDNDELCVYVGTWGARRGRVWWDDVELEEIALLNVLRRPGCHLTVRGEDDVLYEEGRDFQSVRDPSLDANEIYHAPPGFQLPQGTRIRAGESSRVSYYHLVVMWRAQTVNCLSEPVIYELMEEEIRRVDDLLHPRAFFMQHDEIRVANWDEVCRGRGLTPGELLAENVHRCIQIIRGPRPDADLWVWSDMFDPHHNAGPGFPERDGPFFLVDGSLERSWEGLSSEVGIVNWNSERPADSAAWFSQRGHRQILAGYYDADEDGGAMGDWLHAALDLPGVAGAMFTTWMDNYSNLECWAHRVWGDAGRRSEIIEGV